MAVLPLRVYPDPLLRVRCQRLERFDEALRALVADLVETMHDAPGVGLAAPQVGVAARVAVVDVSVGEDPQALHVLVNPEVVESEGSDLDVEGCLSIPGITAKVERPERVRVRAQDVEGGAFELSAEGLLARAVCHEIDHLDGVLFVDRLRGLRREQARRQLRRLARDTEVKEREGATLHAGESHP